MTRRFDRPRKRYTIRREWMRLMPERGWDMDFWVSVAKRVREQGVAHRDTMRVRRICLDVNAAMRRQGR